MSTCLPVLPAPYRLAKAAFLTVAAVVLHSRWAKAGQIAPAWEQIQNLSTQALQPLESLLPRSRQVMSPNPSCAPQPKKETSTAP